MAAGGRRVERVQVVKLDGGLSERRAGCLEQAVDSEINLCKPNRFERGLECRGKSIVRR